MRITATLGCVIVALDCASKALGEVEQSLFNGQWLWVWWIVAGYWALSALVIAVQGFTTSRA